MQRLNWDDLRLFLAVARSGRMSEAARRLGLDHSTIARRLAALEAAIGTRLVDRTPRGAVPTEAGHALMDHAERVEAEILSAGALLGGADARVSGVIRLATPEAFGTFIVAPQVRLLQERHPDLRLELVPESQMVRLANREADIAVMLDRPPSGPAVARKLVDYRVGLFASRDYLERYGPIDDAGSLSGHPFAWYIDEMIDIPELRFLREVSADARPIFRSTSIAAQQAAVAGGMGLGILHVFAAEQDARLVRVLAETVEVRRSYWLAMHQDQQRLPKVRAVLDFLDDIVRSARASF